MNTNSLPKSANFNFLARRYPDLERIGALCEHYFTFDYSFSHYAERRHAVCDTVARLYGYYTPGVVCADVKSPIGNSKGPPVSRQKPLRSHPQSSIPERG
jgi:hypothetical protein